MTRRSELAAALAVGGDGRRCRRVKRGHGLGLRVVKGGLIQDPAV